MATSTGEAGPLKEYMEECDVGFSERHHPLPLPPSGSSKRLSLADELEMAIEDSDQPSPPRPQDSPTNQHHIEATPPSDSTGTTPPNLDPAPTEPDAILPSDEQSPNITPLHSGIQPHPLNVLSCDHAHSLI